MCPGTSWGRARGSRGRLCPRTRRTSGLWTGPAPSPRRSLTLRVFSLANRRLSWLLIGQRRNWYRGTTSETEKLVLTVIFWFNRCLIVKWSPIIPAASRLRKELHLLKWRYEGREAAGAIEGENEWLFLKKADNCGAWLEDTIYKGWTKLSFRVFSLVWLVSIAIDPRGDVPMLNDGHESGISDVTTWTSLLLIFLDVTILIALDYLFPI